MIDTDVAPPVSVSGHGLFTPSITIGATIEGVRKVVYRHQAGGTSTEMTSITTTDKPEVPMEKLNEIDGRLRNVENAITRIDERMNHMPTSFGMWAAIIGVVVPVGAAVVGILWWVIDSSIAPLLSKAAG